MIDQKQAYFEDAYKTGKDRIWGYLPEKEKQFRIFLNMREKKLLDIGCGKGVYSFIAAEEGFNTVGIDFSKTAIAAAAYTKKVSCPVSAVRFKQADALDLPFKDNSFDIALDFSCFTHIPKKNWGRYFSQLRKVLKPEGDYILSVWSKNSSNLSEVNGFNPNASRRNWNLSTMDGLNGHLYNHYFTKPELESTIKKYGFDPICITEKQLNSYNSVMPGSDLRLLFAMARKNF